MSKEFDFDIKELKTAISNYNKQSFLVTEQDKINEVLHVCSEILKRNGYKVSEPNTVEIKGVPKYEDLLRIFNDKIAIHYGLDQVKQNYTNITHIKNFVKQRKVATGTNLNEAKRECLTIINIIFDNLEEFNFTRIPGTYILCVRKYSWVIDKALDIINSKKFIIKEKKYAKLIDDGGEDFMMGSGALSIDDL